MSSLQESLLVASLQQSILEQGLLPSPQLLKVATIQNLFWNHTVYTTEACAATGCIYGLQSLCCPRTCQPSFTALGHVYTTGVYAAPGQQEPVLLLDKFTPQKPELHLEVSTLHRLVLLLDVSTQLWPELHLTLSGHQKPCVCRCLHHRAWAAPEHIYTPAACAASGCVYCTPQGPKLHLHLIFIIWKIYIWFEHFKW